MLQEGDTLYPAAPGAGMTLSDTGRSIVKSGSSRPEGIPVLGTVADLARTEEEADVRWC